MTTPKNMVVPGTLVKVTKRPVKKPDYYSSASAIGVFYLFKDFYTRGSKQDNAEFPDGTVFEITSTPKKNDGATVVSVSYQGAEYTTYYWMIRYDTTPV